MKLAPELNEAIQRIEKIKEKIPPYAKDLKESGRFKDFETRLAWDVLRAVYSNKEISDLYDKYKCNDSHITTLAKNALKSVIKGEL